MSSLYEHDSPLAYRVFVGAFLEGDLAARIQALRERYDSKTARITPPHVTLAGTYWHFGPPTPANEAAALRALRELAPQLSTFELTLGGVNIFTGANPVVYLQVVPSSELLAVRARLMDVLGADKHREFIPHLTLAMRLKPKKAEAMLSELERSEWHLRRFTAPIRALQLMQRGKSDLAWRAIGVFPLS